MTNKQPITPLTQNDYINRRDSLVDHCLPESVCVIPAAAMVTRSNDTEYPFRQDSDFWYLTGFNEPNACLLLSNSSKFGGKKVFIFVMPSNELAEIWNGRRLGVQRAADQLGVDVSYSIDELNEELVNIIDGHEAIYYSFGSDNAFIETINMALDACKKAPKQSKQSPTTRCDIDLILHAMRLQKSGKEIEIMQKAAEISADAHRRAMKYAYPGCNEFELEAEIKHEFAIQGAKNEAYHSIVGGGENACILHYTENDQNIEDGDLVLIDAGCELHGYAADITRTFPVNGKFSKKQRELYQLVLDAQCAALAQLRPNSTIQTAMDTCVSVITEGLIRLGILHGEIEANIKQETWKTFFMHGLGHWLGLDVHDVGLYKEKNKDILLKEGMVLTVEPGIYIPSTADAPDAYKGVGIRIEDDIVITKGGHQILTSGVPKTIEQIEALMADGE